MVEPADEDSAAAKRSRSKAPRGLPRHAISTDRRDAVGAGNCPTGRGNRLAAHPHRKHDDLPADGYARATTARPRTADACRSPRCTMRAPHSSTPTPAAPSRSRAQPCDEPALVIDLELLGSLRMQAAMATAQLVNSWSAANIEADADVLECAFPCSRSRHCNSRCVVVRPCCFWQCRSRRGAGRTVAVVRSRRGSAVGDRRDHSAGARADQPAIGVAAQQPARCGRRRGRRARCEGDWRAARLLGRARNARGVAVERARHRSHRATRDRRHVARIHRRRRASGRHSATARRRCGSCCRSPCCSRATRPCGSRSLQARPHSPCCSPSCSTSCNRPAGESASCASRTSRSAARSAWSPAFCCGRAVPARSSPRTSPTPTEPALPTCRRRCIRSSGHTRPSAKKQSAARPPESRPLRRAGSTSRFGSTSPSRAPSSCTATSSQHSSAARADCYLPRIPLPHCQCGRQGATPGDEVFLDGELHNLAGAFERIADDLSSSGTPPASDRVSTTGSPESACARWIHHHLSHLQAGVDSLAEASAVVRSGVMKKHPIVHRRGDQVSLGLSSAGRPGGQLSSDSDDPRSGGLPVVTPSRYSPRQRWLLPSPGRRARDDTAANRRRDRDRCRSPRGRVRRQAGRYRAGRG